MTTAPTQQPPLTSQLLAVARDIKLSHTVFALPFALLAMFLAAGSGGRLPGAIDFLLIFTCMVTARSFAMLFNRWADREIDAANPRTRSRAVPGGRVESKTALLLLFCCAVTFVGCTFAFFLVGENLWPLILSPLVLFILAGYSYTKRFTWLCHAVLGFALAISPVAASIAIEPSYLSQPTVWLIAVMVLTWVAGFDVLYALQDTDVDRELGLHSIPSRLGVSRALMISRGLHLASMAALISAAWLSTQLGLLFWIAAGLTCALLILEHAMVWGGRTKQLHMAFFTLNGVISVLLGLAGIADIMTASRTG